MSSTLHKTKGVVLRSVKYGDTSLIVSVYTELFGLQSYMVQGVRTSTRKAPGRANYFQPGALLDLVVYHNELKQLQRIREFRWSYLYEHLLSDVIKNSVLLYMVELVHKTVKQPENNPDLFAFIESALLELDKASPAVTASFPIFFALHFTAFFGFQVSVPAGEELNILDLQEGSYTNSYPQHPYFTDGTTALALRELMKVMQPTELTEIPLNRQMRRQLLDVLETYYALHVAEFGKLKTLGVLQEVMG